MWNNMTQKIRKVGKEMLWDSEVLDIRISNCGVGMRVFKVKLESKRNILKNDLGVKMPKLEKNIRKLRTRSRSRWMKK